MANVAKIISLPVVIDNMLSTLLKNTATSVASTLGEIASGYSTSAFLPSLVKDDTRYIEAIIQSQALSDNKLNKLPIQLRAEFSKQLLELLSEWQANQIQHKSKDIHKLFEKRNLSTIFSREETYNILGDGQKKYRLLVLVAPPYISPHCPSYFQHDLPIELQEKLKAFLHKDYPINSDLCPVEFYGDYFMRSISDADVLQLQQILSPVPTVVLHSKITDYEVYFNVNFWHSHNSNIARISLPAWNWEEVKEALQASDYEEIRAIRTTRQIIVTIHQLLAAFITDWYYLHINPIYEPRLFHLESEFALGRWSSDLLRPCMETLQDIHLQQKQAYQQSLKHLVNEKYANTDEQINVVEKPIIPDEYLTISEKYSQYSNIESGRDYSRLRYLLSEKNWQEADKETTKILLNISGQKIKDLLLEQTTINKLGLTSESIQNLPCEALRIIDKLWLNYSNLHFGFSIQTCIWQKVSQNSEDINLNCKDFTEHVGWVANDNWLNHEQITYGLDAPMGHLPFDFTKYLVKTDVNNWGCWYDLYYRIQTCEL